MMADEMKAEVLRFYMTKYSNYGSSIAAFSVVQGVAFSILILTDDGLRKGLLEWELFSAILAGTVVVCAAYLWALHRCHLRETGLARSVSADGGDDIIEVIDRLHGAHRLAIFISNGAVAVFVVFHHVTTKMGIVTH